MPTVNRIAAGLATPALAMLFDLAGMAAYSHDTDISSFPALLWSMLIAAVLFGAPLSVPVALLIRLRAVWYCVPLIAIAAAIGFEVQIRLFGGLLDNANVPANLQLLCMMFYVIPAAFGIATAMLLKRNEKLSIVAAPLALVIVVTLWVQGDALVPGYVAAQTWSVLHRGMSAYTGGNDSGQTICPSLSTYLDFERNGVPRHCVNVASGTPVAVDEIIPCSRTDPAWGWESPHVRIHARDGSLRGFTSAGDLQPDVPAGIPLDMQRDWGAPLNIVNDAGTSTVLGGSAIVRLLRYDPKRDYSLYVQIVDGEHRDMRGWMAIQDVETGGVALGQYSLQYPDTGCS